jgi:hypothetical protein
VKDGRTQGQPEKTREAPRSLRLKAWMRVERSSVLPSPAPWQGNQCHLNKVQHVGVLGVSEPHSIWEFKHSAQTAFLAILAGKYNFTAYEWTETRRQPPTTRRHSKHAQPLSIFGIDIPDIPQPLWPRPSQIPSSERRWRSARRLRKRPSRTEAIASVSAPKAKAFCNPKCGCGVRQESRIGVFHSSGKKSPPPGPPPQACRRPTPA